MSPLTTAPYIYVQDQFTLNPEVVIVLPEIFGLNKHIKSIVDRFAQEFSVLAIGMDYFYPITGTLNDFDYKLDVDKAVSAMTQLGGGEFFLQFRDLIGRINQQYPGIQSITVCGFCFGGRLALLSGMEAQVNTIISFYGGGQHEQFIDSKSTIEALCEVRGNDSGLTILSLFGDGDLLISQKDRELSAQQFATTAINYREVVYPGAGHAFFNNERANYHADYAAQSWEEVRAILTRKYSIA